MLIMSCAYPCDLIQTHSRTAEANPCDLAHSVISCHTNVCLPILNLVIKTKVASFCHILQLVKHLSDCFHVRAQFNNLKACCFNMQVWTLRLLFLLLVGCHYAAGTCSTREFTVVTLQPYNNVLM